MICAIPRRGWLLCAVVLALAACARTPHPIDRYLSELRPGALVPLAGLDFPAGTLLCPLTPYQGALSDTTPVASRVNDFLKRKQFVGDEDHWSLVVIAPATRGDDGIEHLIFKRGNYDIVTDRERVVKAAASLPAAFTLHTCVPVEDARLLVTRAGAQRTAISFGTS